MAEKIKKGFFKVLPLSVVLFLVVALVAGIWQVSERPALAADTITNSVYQDQNGDGTVDRIRWTFDENVTACAYEAEDWTVNTAGSINVSITGISCTGANQYLYIGVTADAGETGGLTDPVISYDNDDADNSITLTSGNMANHASVTATDGTSPVVTGRETADADSDGKIDRMVITTTENLDDDFSGLTIDVAGYAGEAYATNVATDNIFWVNFTEQVAGCSASDRSGCDTDAVPNVQITANTSLSDSSSNNIATGAAVASTDKAPADLVAVAYLNSGTEPSNPGAANVGGGDSDLGLAIQSLTNCTVTIAGGGVANQYDNNEDVYIDNDANNTVSTGDQRITNVFQTYDIGSIVSCPADGDCGGGIQTMTQCKVTGADGIWAPGKEYVYDDINVPGTNTVSVGDSRIYYPETPNNVVDIFLALYSEGITYTYTDSEWTATPNSLTGFDVTGCAFGGLGCTNALPEFLLLTVGGTSVDQTGVVGFGGTEPTISYTYSTNHIQDLVGNNSADIPTATLLDAAKPVITSATYLDTNSNGTVDTIRTSWSEHVTMSGSTSSDWSITGGSLNAAFSSASDDASAGFTLDITVTADANETSAAVAPTISYNDGDNGGSVIDTTSLSNTAESTPPGGPDIVKDGAAPAYLSSSYKDMNGDGRVDRVDATFSENITLTAYANLDWTMGAGTINLGNETAASVQGGNGNSAILNISTTGDASKTGGAAAPTVAYTNNSNNLNDGTNNTATFGAQNIADAAAPVPVSAIYQDNTGPDGQVDRVQLIVSSDTGLSVSSYADADWTITGGTIGLANETWIAIGGANSLILSTLGTIDITGGLTDPTVSYTNNANNVQDGAGNFMATSGAITATDGAAPRIKTVAFTPYRDMDSDGVIDAVEFYWTEDMNTPIYNSAEWSLTGGAFGALTDTGVTETAAGLFRITFTGANANQTSGVGPQVNWLGPVSDNVRDTVGAGFNQAAIQSSGTATDNAASVLRTDGANAPLYQDNDGDGTIDRVRLIFTENTTVTYLDSDWTATANGLTGFDVTGLNGGSGTTTIILDATASANLTGVGVAGTKPQLVYTNAGNRILDGSANKTATWAATNVEDGAAPVLASVSPLNGATSVPIGDPVIWNFSEPMVTSFVHATDFTSAPNPGNWSAIWSNGNKTVTMSHDNYTYGTLINITTTEANVDADSGIPTALTSAGDWSFTTQASGGGGGGGGGGGYAPAAITLISPNGGETWAGNSSHNITWIYSSLAISKVKLLYSLDRGITFPNLIAQNENNDRSYTWTVANVPSSTVKIKIEGYDPSGNLLVSDISDADFAITYTPPVVSATKSTMSAAPSSVVADGTSEATVSVALKDESGAALSGKAVAISSSRTAADSITTVLGITGTDGLATFKVKSSTAGTSTYTATSESVVLDQTAAVVFTTQGTPPPTPSEIPAGLKVGDLIKSSLSSAVYYFGSDNKRHLFPNSLTYRTWYLDWSGVKTIPASQLQGISLGKNVTVRPGTVLVKIQTDPKVYAVEPNGLLRWVPTEARARTLYGENWAARVIDVSLVFWGDYTFGADITTDNHPTGSLIQYSGMSDVYYIQGAEKRRVASEAAFEANNFRWINVLTVPTTLYYALGTDITAAENALAKIY